MSLSAELDCQLALSRAVEELQKMPRGSLGLSNANLFRIYLRQADDAIRVAMAHPERKDG